MISCGVNANIWRGCQWLLLIIATYVVFKWNRCFIDTWWWVFFFCLTGSWSKLWTCMHPWFCKTSGIIWRCEKGWVHWLNFPVGFLMVTWNSVVICWESMSIFPFFSHQHGDYAVYMCVCMFCFSINVIRNLYISQCNNQWKLQ